MAIDFSDPKVARDYIKIASKGKVDDSSLGMQVCDGRIKTTANKRVTVNHVAMAETITKFINATPGLHPLSRKIMTMKIVNPGMTNERIGIILALRNHEIEAYELDGKNRVKDYMRTYSIADGVSKFEHNKGSLNKMQRTVQQDLHHDSPLIRA